ncbi:MAG TPA: hypothetical protein VF651_10290 [Gammaproteobacteria bacterium]
MRIPKRWYIAVSAVAFIGGVLACGPDFPWQLLDDRNVTLRSTPANDFQDEMPAFLPKPADQLKPNEEYLLERHSYYDENWNGSLKAERAAEEERELKTEAEIASIRVMRSQDSDDKAYAAGAGLPEAVRLYTAGAVAYHGNAMTQAARRFEAVLALPADQRKSRATWAAFMLGRIHAAAGEEADAARYFTMTREFALQGAPDPLGLAVASYNEEAGMHYRLAEALLHDGVLPADQAEIFGRHMTVAGKLYGEAEARGSRWSFNSLVWVAGEVMAEPVRVEAAARDPFMQHLLVAYTLGRIPDASTERSDYYFDYFIDGHHPLDAASGKPNMILEPSVAVLVAVLEKHPASRQGWDGLGAIMYRAGRYDLAAKLVADSSTPMAAWLKAKLAIQKGDLAKAAEFYSQAVESFKSTKAGISDYNAVLLQGEQATLALARGEYLDALDKLYAQGDKYWGDIAYVAERILTTDELKQFVDTRGATVQSDHVVSDEDYYGITAGSRTELRDLLARRLVRDGRYNESLVYFHGSKESGFADPQVRDHVTAYAKALAIAEGKEDSLARAHAWYDAGVLAREWGMEMMGYESAPDYFSVQGYYAYGYGQEKTGGSFVTDDEKRRFSASTAKPDSRFHYRFLAVDDLRKAAALVPPRGQAYAAILCTAAGWMYHTQDQAPLGDELYKQYVAHGAIVDFATHFGNSCPDPDFTETAADVTDKAHAQTVAWIAARKAAGHPVNRLSFIQRIMGKIRRHMGLALLAVLGLMIVLAGAAAAGIWRWHSKPR